jgi:hypothetical protein
MSYNENNIYNVGNTKNGQTLFYSNLDAQIVLGAEITRNIISLADLSQGVYLVVSSYKLVIIEDDTIFDNLIQTITVNNLSSNNIS